MEELDSKKSYKLKKFIKKLDSVRAPHTELITVYIPKDYDLNKIINHLSEEQGTASNIKSKVTRTNVIDALEKMIRHLKLYKQTPPNGLAVFSGNLAAKEGKKDFKVFSIEPPVPLNTRLYRCDQTFVLDILKEQLEHNESYALIVMDKREANIGILKGNSVIQLSKLTSGVPGKYRTGGQSAARFSRLREEAAHVFYNRIAETVQKEFLNKKEIKGILIGGPGPTKQEFVDGDFLVRDLKDKIIAVKDITYTDEFGLNELVEKSNEVLSQESITKEKLILNRFFTMLAKEPEKTAYGLKETKKALEMGAVEVLILSETLDDTEELEEMAENTSAETEIVSIETQEGIQFKNLGEIGAILRYAIS